MYAYKGFEPDLSCRGYRFVMGKNVTPEANCASNGFHCAENPLDCLSYYGNMNRSIYCLVQPGGDIDEDNRDSKIACTELTILRRLTKKEFFLHALAYMVDHPSRKVNDKVQREHSTSRSGYAVVRGKAPTACGKLGDVLAFARERRETEVICQIAVVEVDAEGSTTSYTYDANGQMTKTTSAMGAETSSTYDALGRQISSADALGHVTGYEYDVLGRATKITYADGGFVAYTYDANGQVLTATDELGGVISYAYDANGRLIEMTDAMGGKTAYAYDAVGNVTSVTDALGGSTTYRYDETGNMTSVTDANGNTTGYSYDALGRAVAVTDANGGVTRAEYDHNGNIVKAVDAEGNATTYVYDALDRLASYTNAEGYTFSFQYDNEGNTVASTDGNGNTTRYTYDGLNRAVSSTNAEGNTAYNTYDADGRMVKSVNEEGAETAYAYDADGRLISMTDALGNVTGFEYDSRDRVIKVADAKGNATTFTYDLAGNVKSETNAKGVVTSYTYDANGNLTSMTDAAGTVTYTYDALNRVTSVKDRRGNTQFFTYDATDRIVQVKDRNGNVTRYVYDGNGNIVKTIDALGTESVFTYNKNDQLISTDLHRVDALNGVNSHEITLYEYDGRNLVTKEINALGDSTVYVYDGNGNLVSKTDADGYVTRYSYTSLDLVKKINYNGAKEVSYQYNKVGELVQMDDWTGTNTFELDLLGRLQKMTDHKGNTVSYTYDAVGNQTGITYPDGSKVSNFYDAVYNLTSVIDADDGTYAYVYDAANRPVKLTYPNGWIEQYTYDAEGNLLKTVDTDPFQLYNKTPKVKYEYTYDAEGNVLTEFQRDSDATENLKSRTAFTYDALNRLTGSTRRLEVYPYDTLAYAYTYDTLGNLLKQSGPTKGEEDTYQYNDLNQMVSKHVCGYEQKITRIYDYGYTYDKRGNLVKEEEICSPTTTGPKNITIATYLYDETNRMVQGTNKAGEVSAYTFNGLGVRVGTELILEDNSHGYTDFHCQTPSVETGIEKPEVVKTDYVIDYTRLDIDQRVLMKSEQDGYDFFYTYGLDKLQVMTIGEGSNWWGQSIKKCVNMAYVHTDRLGSVVNLSDQYGRVTARADYTDWGEVRRYTDITVDGGFRRLLPEITYATHEYDDVLNQFYAKARMYDAENKRFDAVDPILDSSGYDISSYVSDPMMLVQYLYVVDNPICSTDPLGLLGESVSNWVQEKLYDAAEYLRQKVGDVTKHFTNPVRKSDLEMGIVASLLISAGDTSAMMLQALINTGRYMTGQLPSMEYFNSYLRTKSQINQYFLNRVSYTDSYYLGKSIGDIIGTAVGLGMTAKGISELLAGIGGIGSGVGAVALPICVAISAEGVVTAGAGVTVAAAAAGNFGGDFEKFRCEAKKTKDFLTPHQKNEFKKRILANEDVEFKTKQQAIDFINEKFPQLKMEQAKMRSAEGWHFDSHPINGSGYSIDHINIYSKRMGFRVHITWTE